MKIRWLLKSDPETYGWDDLVRDGTTRWDGVRNFQARNYLRQIPVGDQAWFYHSQSDRAIVGVVEIIRSAYPDLSAKTGDWSCVNIRPVQPVTTRVHLVQLRKQLELKNFSLIKQGRLSVMPVTEMESACIKRLAYGA